MAHGCIRNDCLGTNAIIYGLVIAAPRLTRRNDIFSVLCGTLAGIIPGRWWAEAAGLGDFGDVVFDEPGFMSVAVVTEGESGIFTLIPKRT